VLENLLASGFLAKKRGPNLKKAKPTLTSAWLIVIVHKKIPAIIVALPIPFLVV
jgi:hypothetical protein